MTEIDYLHNTTVNMEEDLKEITKRIDMILDRLNRTGNAQFAVVELKILCEELDLR